MDYDVIVVGAGNAAFAAAVSRRNMAERVLVLERPRSEKRGATAFCGAIFASSTRRSAAHRFGLSRTRLPRVSIKGVIASGRRISATTS